MSEVSRILSGIEEGDAEAASRLLPLVYDELRKLAAQKMAQERPGQTLDATALVHEAYLRLMASGGRQPAESAAESAESGDQPHWHGRNHFFAAAAEAMRRILIESARHKRRIKHGGEFKRVELHDQPEAAADDNLLALDEALTRLAAEDALAAKVVELRHFAGLGHKQIADALGITVYLARQKWTYARAWLRNALGTR